MFFSNRNKYLSTALLFIILFAIFSTVGIFLDVQNTKNQFNKNASQLYRMVNERLNQNEVVLNGFVAMMNVLNSNDYDQLRPYAREMLNAYPHIYELGNIDKVLYDDLKAFQQDIRNRKYPNFEIKEFDFEKERRWKPVGKRNIYYPLVFIEPEAVAQEKALIGMDIGAFKGFKNPMLQAIKTGEIVASNPFNRIEGGQGYVLFHAIYKDKIIPKSPELRIENSLKVASLLVRGERLFHQNEKPNNYSLVVQPVNHGDNQGQAPIVNFESTEQYSSFDNYFPKLSFNLMSESLSQKFMISIGLQMSFHQVEKTSMMLSLLLAFLCTNIYSIYIKRQKEKEQSIIDLEHEKMRAQVTLQSIADAVITCDTHGKVTDINPAACLLLMGKETTFLGKAIEDCFELHFESNETLFTYDLEHCIQNRCNFSYGKGLILKRKEIAIEIEDVSSPMISVDGTLLGVTLVLRDVSHQRRLTGKLEYQATHDELTGLFNRRYFENKIKWAVDSIYDSTDTHALIYFDLDNFKIVNDTCGHEAGDQLLKQLAELLLSRLRKRDILARLGGDEFAILLLDCDQQFAKKISNDILEKVTQLDFKWNNLAFNVGFSAGVVFISEQLKDSKEIMKRADSACYKAKDNGKNNIVIDPPFLASRSH